MSNKLNIFLLIKGHFKTLYSAKTEKISLTDLFTFFALPAFLSAIAVLAGFCLDKDMASIVSTISSIFAGLLLNLLMLVYTVLLRVKDINTPILQNAEQKTVVKNKLKIKIIKELFYNIAYSIVICIVVMILCLFYLVRCNVFDFVSFFCFYFLSNLFLTVLMVLKRICSIFLHEVDN